MIQSLRASEEGFLAYLFAVANVPGFLRDRIAKDCNRNHKTSITMRQQQCVVQGASGCFFANFHFATGGTDAILMIAMLLRLELLLYR